MTKAEFVKEDIGDSAIEWVLIDMSTMSVHLDEYLVGLITKVAEEPCQVLAILASSDEVQIG